MKLHSNFPVNAIMHLIIDLRCKKDSLPILLILAKFYIPCQFISTIFVLHLVILIYNISQAKHIPIEMRHM